VLIISVVNHHHKNKDLSGARIVVVRVTAGNLVQLLILVAIDGK